MAAFELIQRIRAVAAADPDRVAYVEAGGGVLTYRQLSDGIDAARAEARSVSRSPAVVMLRCGNRGAFATRLLGLLSAGCDVFPVHPNLAGVEVETLAARAGAVRVVNDELPSDVGQHALFRFVPDGSFRTTQRPDNNALASTPTPAASDPTAQGSAWKNYEFDDKRSEPNDEGHCGTLLLSSSGSTGTPKIVRRSAASLDAVAAAMVEAIGFTPADHVLAGVPLSHSYGLEHGLLAPLWAGATVHLCEGLDVPAMHAKLAGPITIFPAVPPMIEMLGALADAPPAMPRLRRVYSAGGPLGAAVTGRFAARFGRRVGQVYGMTEIGSVTYADPDRHDRGVGRPMAGVSVRVIDDEIAVRADSMFDGYLGDTVDLIDGHFRTGDLGHVDAAGNVILTGRTRLLIDVGGIKVNPLEVEAVIRRHPGVADCCVVPLRQSETIARLRAVVEPRDPATPPPAAALRQFARERLAPFKVPRVIEYCHALPRSPAGKVLREALAASSSSAEVRLNGPQMNTDKDG